MALHTSFVLLRPSQQIQLSGVITTEKINPLPYMPQTFKPQTHAKLFFVGHCRACHLLEGLGGLVS